MATSKYELAAFVLHNLDGFHVRTDAGDGTCGALWDVEANGLLCSARKLGPTSEVSAEDRKRIQQKLQKECIFLSKLRHPNIIHFVGISYGETPEDLILVTERFQTNLEKLMANTPPSSLPVKLSLLCDISYGLQYLHSLNPTIIHQDLCPRNVLITTDTTAKLTDLEGSFGLVEKHAPGIFPATIAKYQPPEWQGVKEECRDPKCNVFSFGLLTLFVVNEMEPQVRSLCATRFIHISGSTEVARRQKDVDRLGKEHCLHKLLLRCLQDSPRSRPHMLEVNSTLKRLCLSHPRILAAEPEKSTRVHKESSEGNVIQQLQMELVACQSEVEVHKLKAVSLEEEFEQERKDREQALARAEELKQRYSQDLNSAVAKLEKSREEVEELQEAKEKLTTRVQELVYQMEHCRRETEASQRDAKASREQAEEMRAEMRQLTWKERELAHECKKYRIEADVCRREAEAQRRQAEAYKKQLLDVRVTHFGSMEPSEKKSRWFKTRSKTISGSRGVFETKCAELEIEVDRLKRENARLLHASDQTLRSRHSSLVPPLPSVPVPSGGRNGLPRSRANSEPATSHRKRGSSLVPAP